MRNALMVTLVAVLAGSSAIAQSIAGEWQGTLKVGAQELRLVLHVGKNKRGALQATFDSVDQDAFGISVTSIAFKDSKLDFTIESIHGSYEGVLSADGKTIRGTWMQGTPLPLDFTLAHAKAVQPSDIDGTWLGALQAGAVKLRVVFHIFNTEYGLHATLDSPDQGAQGIPFSSVTRAGSHITMEAAVIGGKFEGTVDSTRTSIAGTWTQSGTSQALTLKRIKNTAQPQPVRPQNPKAPLPYRQEQVTFLNKKAGIRLAGTVTIPPGKGPFPAVALIAGSGPLTRDEPVMGHRPFLVLADYLTRRKIVVLRYDKRGVGQSGGNYATATTPDFASDAHAAFEYLRAQDEVNPHGVGLIGHSEGGEIAPMVAAEDRNVAFIVMLAGPSVPGDRLLVAQKVAILEAMGVSPARAEKEGEQERELLSLIENSRNGAALDNELRVKLRGQVPPAMLGAEIKQLRSPWFLYFIHYNPASTLARVKCPVLALIGAKDTQVPAKQNLPAIRSALLAGGNRNFEVEEMPGLNHLFQPARTGAPAEYGEIETTISPAALEKIYGWIAAQTGR